MRARILVTGGVAANRELRARFTAEADRRGLRVAFPTLALSTDNAAMIAAAAWPRYVAGDFADGSLSADPRWRWEDSCRCHPVPAPFNSAMRLDQMLCSVISLTYSESCMSQNHSLRTSPSCSARSEVGISYHVEHKAHVQLTG